MQTASQIIAAKRAAKRNAEIRREANKKIGNKTADRNELAQHKSKQNANVLRLQHGEPHPQENATGEEIKHLLHYQTLVYQHDIQSETVFEKTIRAFKVVAAIYKDHQLHSVCSDAETALHQQRDHQGSPNQRRIILRPLIMLTNYVTAYSKILPKQTTEIIAAYCSSVQAALYTTALFEHPNHIINALFNIINGDSLRSQAKKHSVKEPELRADLMSAAWCLYRIAECFFTVSEPKGIPDLRRREWQPFATLPEVRDHIQAITQQWLIPFETQTGITLINYTEFRERLIKIEQMN